MKIFVMKRPGIIGVYPYNNVFENNRYWNEVELNIFVEDRKMITEKFYKIDTNDIKFDYKENSNLKKLID